LKYGYIELGKMNPEMMGFNTEQRKKKMQEFAQQSEKKGFKVLMWGHPYGVSENIVVVYESEKPLADFTLRSLPAVMDDNRTILTANP